MNGNVQNAAAFFCFNFSFFFSIFDTEKGCNFFCLCDSKTVVFYEGVLFISCRARAGQKDGREYDMA
jgi:hypothetical protein